ncbi:hypothetical protein T01_2998 [Trichinella spiralis]|uniref:Uncharacterized protein n=1 Tax=Trichinella spiralis TaxID=6334 RepID=A0A0V1BCD0_TRISP|nr:hypothetical protein T01_2998 [Trichinella spiralis]
MKQNNSSTNVDRKAEYNDNERCEQTVGLQSFSRTIPELMVSLKTGPNMSRSAELPSYASTVQHSVRITQYLSKDLAKQQFSFYTEL